MFVIDFNQNQREAFLHGVMKGMAAPISLFHNEPAPALPHVVHVTLPDTSAARVLAGDWQKIGGDLKMIVSKHGQDQAARKTA